MRSLVGPLHSFISVIKSLENYPFINPLSLFFSVHYNPEADNRVGLEREGGRGRWRDPVCSSGLMGRVLRAEEGLVSSTWVLTDQCLRARLLSGAFIVWTASSLESEGKQKHLFEKQSHKPEMKQTLVSAPSGVALVELVCIWLYFVVFFPLGCHVVCFSRIILSTLSNS